MARYNGWTNYETWNVALWLDNEESTHRYWAGESETQWLDAESDDRVSRGTWTREQAAVYNLEGQLKEEVKDGAPDLGASMWSDLLGAALDEVDWREIAQHYIDAIDKTEEEEDDDETEAEPDDESTT